MTDFIVNGGYQGDVSFYTQDNRVQRFSATPNKGNASTISGAVYGVVSLSDDNLHENYDAPSSQPTLTSSHLLNGAALVNRIPKMRPRVVSYKLFFKSKSPRLNIYGTQFGMLGRGVKEYVQAFVREFLDIGDLKVQYGTWGGVDIGGYLVDAPQATYSPDGTQAILSFVLQFTNPITLHPNFTNSTIWSNTSDSGTSIDWATLTTGDSSRLLAKNVSATTSTHIIGAYFKNVKRYSNFAVYIPATGQTSETVSVEMEFTKPNIGTYFLATSSIVTQQNTPTLTYFLGGNVYSIDPTQPNNAANLTKNTATSVNGAGFCGVLPCGETSSDRVTLKIRAFAESSYSKIQNARFCSLGW